jgi:hypothetical protein
MATLGARLAVRARSNLETCNQHRYGQSDRLPFPSTAPGGACDHPSTPLREHEGGAYASKLAAAGEQHLVGNAVANHANSTGISSTDTQVVC